MRDVLFYDQTRYPKIARLAIAIPLILILILCYTYAQETIFISLLGFVFIILIVSAYYMYKSGLVIQLSEEGVSYTLYSFSKKSNHIPLSDIQQIALTALDYTSKFGGWGYRKNKNGEAFIFNDGLFLHVQTAHQVYYFSISDAQKKACRNLLEQYSLPYTKKE
ncbi:hypothetical protein HX004_01975 [Myroides sp. 1354]|uniref:hypothetical protein n=1 Tax=unclassified Myroides TaxID=2642485 RepID=UPI0025754E88|nr:MULTISPECIES: hypothetical protein [unclassified Myroides]MDM1043393.1 hypothetical protein [Myroides sp. R163-1]MDM1054556.1 hypothetical protein [Myroides sp. 1354]MDM1067853.1 hypothetical protein [Myroides sp. 1372]